MNTVAVFCGSRIGLNHNYIEETKKLAQMLAKNHVAVAYGGASIGLMDIIASEALANNGKVIGVMPKSFEEDGIVKHNLSQLIWVEDLAERKKVLAKISDAFIILPGGYGTLDELFEMLAMKQIGLLHKKICILNIDGFYDPLFELVIRMRSEKFITEEYFNYIFMAHSVEAIETYLF